MNIVRRKINVRTYVESGIERHPVPVLGTDYKVKIVYKNVRVPELDVQDKVIKISLPNRYKKSDNQEILDLAIEKMYEQIAKVEIERAMEKTRIMLGFAPDDYEIKNMLLKLNAIEEHSMYVEIEVEISASVYEERQIIFIQVR